MSISIVLASSIPGTYKDILDKFVGQGKKFELAHTMEINWAQNLIKRSHIMSLPRYLYVAKRSPGVSLDPSIILLGKKLWNLNYFFQYCVIEESWASEVVKTRSLYSP